jgi:hypothetical protein
MVTVKPNFTLYHRQSIANLKVKLARGQLDGRIRTLSPVDVHIDLDGHLFTGPYLIHSAQYTRVWTDKYCGSLLSSEQIEPTGGGPITAGQEPQNSVI